MKKTISIALGGYAFNIEEAAYERLKEYLDAVAAHFARYPDSQEIMTDMEARIGEHFGSRSAGQAAGRIISMTEVDELIATMGRVEDFGDEPVPEEAGPAVLRAGKRLMRDPKNKIIAGVAGGLAAYFGLDPIIMRLLFVAATIFGGWGIALYVLLWALTPEAVTETEQMQMRGTPLTVAGVEQFVRSKISAEETRRGEGSVTAALKTVGAIFRTALDVTMRILGMMLSVAAALGIAALIVVFFAVVLNFDSPYVDVPLRAAIGGPLLWSLSLLGFYAAFAPLALLAYLGGSLARMKFSINKSVFFSMLGLWIVVLAIGAGLALKVAPRIHAAIEASAQAETVTRVVDASGFDAIRAHGVYRIELTQGPRFAVVAEGAESDLERMNTRVSEGALELSLSSRPQPRFCVLCLQSQRQPTLRITMPKVETIKADDAVRIHLDGFAQERLVLEAGDVARIDGVIRLAETLKADVRDAARVSISGTAKGMTLSLQDVGRFEGEDLQVAEATVTARDASRAEVNASDKLSVTAMNVSSVYYRNAPETFFKQEGDVARIRPIDPLPPIE